MSELPESYNIYFPKIQLTPFEDICQKSRFDVQLPNLKLTRLTEADLKALTEEAGKRQLRTKPKLDFAQLFHAEDEDDIMIPEEYEERANPVRDRTYTPKKGLSRVFSRVKSRKFRFRSRREPSTSSDLRCRVCSPAINFLEPEQFQSHFDHCHREDGQYVCSSCTHKSESILTLTQHSCSKRFFHICYLCSPLSEWDRKDKYIEHMKSSHLNSGKYSCLHCTKEWTTINAFNNHARRHALPYIPKTKPFYENKIPCNICGKYDHARSTSNIPSPR
jgi:hypothetical protein